MNEVLPPRKASLLSRRASPSSIVSDTLQQIDRAIALPPAANAVDEAVASSSSPPAASTTGRAREAELEARLRSLTGSALSSKGKFLGGGAASARSKSEAQRVRQATLRAAVACDSRRAHAAAAASKSKLFPQLGSATPPARRPVSGATRRKELARTAPPGGPRSSRRKIKGPSSARPSRKTLRHKDVQKMHDDSRREHQKQLREMTNSFLRETRVRSNPMSSGFVF